MKTFTAIALALLVGVGVGYGVSSFMGSKNVATVAAIEAPTSTAPTTIEPTAEVVHGADDPVVAKVDGKPVYKTEVMDFIKTLPPQMQQADVKAVFPMALDQVISGKIVDAKASTENLDNDPTVLKRMALARTQIVRAVYAENAINKEFNDGLVKKAYDDIVKSMPKVEEVHARHILVDNEAQAKTIITKLNGGAKFEDLAKEFSKDKSNSASGGDLGYFAQTDMVKEFSDAAFALKANEYTKAPVKTQFGFHVIQSLDKRERPAPKFEDVKTQVEGQVRRDILNNLVETWNKSATVEKFDMDGKPVVAAPAADATPKPTEEKATDVAPAEEKPAETAPETTTPATPAPAEDKKAE